jgi:chemotaxis protein CheD
MTELNLIKVGMADLNAVSGSGVLRTTGLGSCVGVTLYDPTAKVAGMAHIMLPSSNIAREAKLNLAKYADTAIPELIRRMCGMNVTLSNMKAKLAGGAQMFAFAQNTDTLRIGPRNVESCREVLRNLKIPIVAEDTGGRHGRTIEIHCQTGILYIRSVQHGTKEL